MSSCGVAGVYGVVPAAADACPHPAGTSGSRLSLRQAQHRRCVLAEQPGSLSLIRTRSPQPITLRETGRPTGMPVPDGGLIRCCLPAGRPEDCFGVCAQTCGWLVRNGAEPVRTQWKCWGFRCRAAIGTGPLPGRAL